MKTFSFLLMSFFLSFSLNSCFGSDDDDSHNDDDDDNGNSGSMQVIVEGEWKVTHFSEDGNNQTSNFNGFIFDFITDGALTATKSETIKSGNWNDGNDDSGNKLIINFPSAPDDDPFEEISEDWDIIAKTPAKIELKHVSGGDGDIDLLTFEKL